MERSEGRIQGRQLLQRPSGSGAPVTLYLGTRCTSMLLQWGPIGRRKIALVLRGPIRSLRKSDIDEFQTLSPGFITLVSLKTWWTIQSSGRTVGSTARGGHAGNLPVAPSRREPLFRRGRRPGASLVTTLSRARSAAAQEPQSLQCAAPSSTDRSPRRFAPMSLFEGRAGGGGRNKRQSVRTRISPIVASCVLPTGAVEVEVVAEEAEVAAAMK